MVQGARTGRALAASLLLLLQPSSLFRPCDAFFSQGGALGPATTWRRDTAKRSASTAFYSYNTKDRSINGIEGQPQRHRLTALEMADTSGGDSKTRVLFVCLGNICRSPTAEAVFKQVTSKAGETEKFEIDSCGTGGGSSNWYKDGGESYHEGDSPDARMTAAAAKRGITLEGGSRPLKAKDLEEFDLIVGMDGANAQAISTAAEHWGKGDLAAEKLRTMTSYCRSSGDVKTVPDPYYGGPKGFETVLDLLDDACEGLLEKCLEGKP